MENFAWPVAGLYANPEWLAKKVLLIKLDIYYELVCSFYFNWNIYFQVLSIATPTSIHVIMDSVSHIRLLAVMVLHSAQMGVMKEAAVVSCSAEHGLIHGWGIGW